MTEGPVGLDEGRGARRRRAAISVFLVLSLIAIGCHLVFASELQRNVLKVVRPYAVALGFDQSWGVFAPDVRPATIGVRARIEYADGSAEWWNLPRGNAITGEYSDYRWRKWLEYILNPAYKQALAPSFVAWLAHERTDARHKPVRITIVGRWYDLYAPGSRKGRLRSDWHEVVIYSAPVTAAMRAGT
jgi:hypothetical protein